MASQEGNPPPLPIPGRIRSYEDDVDESIIFPNLAFLDEALVLGLEKYSEKITEVIDRKEPLTDRAFQSVHQDIKSQVVDIFKKSFDPLQIGELSEELQAATEKLTSNIQCQWVRNKTKFDNEMNYILKTLRDITNEAEEYYEIKMDEFIQKHGQPTKYMVEKKHGKSMKRALAKFDRLLEEAELENHSSFKIELEKRLADRRFAAIELCIDSNLQLAHSEVRDENLQIQPQGFIVTTNESKQIDGAPSTHNQQTHLLTVQEEVVSKSLESLIDLRTRENLAVISANGANSKVEGVAGVDPFDPEWLQQQGKIRPSESDDVFYDPPQDFSPIQHEEKRKKKPAPPPPVLRVKDEARASPTVLRRISYVPHVVSTSNDDMNAAERSNIRPKKNSFDIRPHYGNRSPGSPPLKVVQTNSGVPGFFGHRASDASSSTGSAGYESVILNIGIYIDESSVQIGSLDETDDTLKIWLSQAYPVNLTFTDAKTKAVQAQGFSMYELIKTHGSAVEVALNGNIHKMKVEALVTNIFKEMFLKIREIIQRSVGQVVVTTSFSLTCAEKERLKISIEKLKCKGVRVLSSLMSTALAHRKNVFYWPNSKEKKHVLLVNSFPKYFTLGVVKMAGLSMAVRSYHSSENMPSATSDFEGAYRKVTHGDAQDPDVLRTVREVVLKAWKSVLKEVTKGSIDEVVFVNIPLGSALSAILEEFFSNVNGKQAQIDRQEQCPLLGASLFSSKDNLRTQFISERIELFDSHRPKLTLLVNNQVEKTFKRSHKIEKGYVFCHFVHFPLRESTVTLREQFYKNQPSYSVCEYKVVSESESSGKDSLASIHCRIDHDGVYSIKINFETPVVRRDTVRSDVAGEMFEAESVPSSGGVRSSLQIPKWKGGSMSKAIGRVIRSNTFRRSEDLPAGIDKRS